MWQHSMLILDCKYLKDRCTSFAQLACKNVYKSACTSKQEIITVWVRYSISIPQTLAGFPVGKH